MENASVLSHSYYANGAPRSETAVYAGVNGDGTNYVTCVAFTLARPASSVTVGLQNYAFNNSTSERPLRAGISDLADDPAFINHKGEGEAGFWFPGWSTGGYTVSFTIEKKLSAGQHYLYIFSGGGGLDYCRILNSATTISYAPILASTIRSYSAAVSTGETFSLVMDKPAAANRHIAGFYIGGVQKAVSTVFDTTLGYTPPRSWFTGYPAAASLTVTVSVQSYSDQSCAQPLGDAVTASFTLHADPGMKPKLLAGFAAAAPYNTGAVSGLRGCVQGYSQMEITFNSTKIDMSDTCDAEIAKISLDSPGVSVSAPPYRSGVITGKTELKCSVTDSRGRSAGLTITVEPLPYAPPSLTETAVFRCLPDGRESEDGMYYSAAALPVFSALNGENSCTLRCALAPASGDYGAETALESGAAAVLGGTLSPDRSYLVRLTATDALGNTGRAVVKLPTRKWAMKFRPGGMGLAFGKAPEADNVLELPEGWGLTIGGKSYLEQVYPVGAVYLSTVDTDPAALFGFGVWERVKDRFLLAAGDSYAPGSTGGAAQITQTVEQMPLHGHQVCIGEANNAARLVWSAGEGSQDQNAWGFSYGSPSEYGNYVNAAGTGESQPIDIMPPYLAVYIWRRTA